VRISGAAALALLNEDAHEWQQTTSPELDGHYLTTVDYVSAHLAHWGTRDVLLARIEAAAHAYKLRARLAIGMRIVVLLLGIALGVAIKEAVKPGMPHDGVEAISGLLGGALLTATKEAVKLPFLDVHKERATLWKKLLDRLRSALVGLKDGARA
jgi:hypothetical protein